MINSNAFKWFIISNKEGFSSSFLFFYSREKKLIYLYEEEKKLSNNHIIVDNFLVKYFIIHECSV